MRQDGLYSAAYSGAHVPYSPTSFLASWWKHAGEHLEGYQQQDAHEFYLYTLSGLARSLLSGLADPEPAQEPPTAGSQSAEAGAAAAGASAALSPLIANGASGPALCLDASRFHPCLTPNGGPIQQCDSMYCNHRGIHCRFLTKGQRLSAAQGF